MAYVNFQSDDICFDIDLDGKPGFVRIAAMAEAFLIERGEMVDGVGVVTDRAIVPICDNDELRGLFVNGEWDLYGLELLLCPTDTDLTLTDFARRQLEAKAV